MECIIPFFLCSVIINIGSEIMNTPKIVIIHPNQTIDYIGSIDSLNTHSEALLEYAKNNYKNIPIFSKLNYRHTPETISYFYTLLGDVIFLNTTKDIKRHGYTGLFILPLEVSPEQKEQTLEFADSLKEYQVRILHHLSLEYGILNGEEMQQTLCNSPKELLLHYFEHVNSKKK